MKALAWYTVIFNILVCLLFILNIIGVVPKPPFTVFENIIWVVLTLPVIGMGLLAIQKLE